ncbi:MAG TPA: dTDP-4-dehydrorhamnose reductase [Bacteroidales bacterium]|nr:dTDP-4-dehydrorhamnose reductase [Bacteroidales bacterium]
MAVILVTGSEGQLGNELKVVSRNYYGYDFIFTDADTLDIRDKDKTKAFISETKPGWIINCAAYNLVDTAESDPETAMLINGTAVRNITEAISGSNCRLIHVSTDYVYDGTGNTPYSEDTEPRPLSAYGRSKLTGEKYALMHYGSMVIRTSWLYSSFGNNFVKTILKNAREKESLNVVFDQTGTPTYAAHLAGAIMTIVSGVIKNQFVLNAGIYNYSDEGLCSWYDFAVEIVKEAGLDCNIMPILTKDYRTIAQRPVYSVMNKTKIKENYDLEIPHWRSGLQECMKLL